MNLFTTSLLKKMKNSNNEDIWVIRKGKYLTLFPDGDDSKISLKLLDEILCNDDLYKYCLELLSKNCYLKIYKSNSIYDNEFLCCNFSKFSIINALIESKDRYQKDSKKSKKVEELINTSSYDFYLEKVEESYIIIGNKNIKIKDIINWLNSPLTEKNLIITLKKLNITISELIEALKKPPMNLFHIYGTLETSILEGHRFPKEVKKQLVQNISYLNENSYLFNILPNSNYYVLDIIDFFRNNNIEEYVKNNDNILGYSFQEIAIFLNEYLFGEDIEHDILSEERNFFSYSFSESLPKNLEEILENFMDLYIPDPLAEKEFLVKNNYSNVEVDEELINQILKEIPENYTDFQKVYFVYKYICANFVYDPYYLAGSQREKYDINHHKQIESVKNINLINNKVVCYDISVIIAKLIERLGLPVQLITSNGKKLNDYGSRHAAVKTKVGEYWIKLDIADGLIHNDMTYQHLTGNVYKFSILNIVKRTCLKAKREMEEVDRDFNEKYDSYKKHVTALNEYRDKYSKNDTVSFDEKIGVVIAAIQNSKIDDTSKILYVKDVIKIVFGGKEDKCFVAFVGSKINTRTKNEIALGCILICNDSGILTEGELGQKYYLFPNLREYKELSKEQIEELIRTGRIVGIKQFEIDIAGLDAKLNYGDNDGGR